MNAIKLTQVTSKLSPEILNLEGFLTKEKIKEYLKYEFGEEDNNFDYSHFTVDSDEVTERKYFDDGKLAHVSILKLEDLHLSIGHKDAFDFSKTL